MTESPGRAVSRIKCVCFTGRAGEDGQFHRPALHQTGGNTDSGPEVTAAESGIVKIKTIAARNTDILAGRKRKTAGAPRGECLADPSASPSPSAGTLKENSSEVVQPFLMGCGTKEPKITQLCLAAIQRLMSHEVVSEAAAGNIINMLWQLMENGLEELKLLQTVLVLLTTNTVVHDEVLSKAIVLCFRLHFTKDNITNNTAAATVRQVVTVVFERMVAEDERHKGKQQPQVDQHPEAQCQGRLHAVPGDTPDLCQLVNADAPYWLVGMTEMTRTFGLELLESVLNDFPGVFLQHQEFSFLLKERVCPLVIKLFSPNIKFRQGMAAPSPAPVEKPYFPICMRLLRVVTVLIKHFYSLLVTECEIFLSLLVKFLDGEKPQWLRAVAVESIHRLCVQPHLLRSFCQSYDMKQHSTKVFRDIVNALGSFIQSLFIIPSQGNPAPATAPSGGSVSGGQAGVQGGPSAVGGGGGLTTQAAFEYRGTWIPLMTVSVQGSAKATYLEMLDKVEPPSIPEGYAMSVAFSALLDLVRGITAMIERELAKEEESAGASVRNGTPQGPEGELQGPGCEQDPVAQLVWEEMVSACWCGLLAALSLLLDARAVEGPSTVLTTAVMSDLPVISSVLSRLFESSQYLDDVSLHHLINALCSLSMEAMEMAYGNNKEPSLFAVAKLLETGLVNMDRIEILWRPLTDIRQKQLESVLQILQSQGDSLGPGWPLVLGVIGAIRNDQGESLIRTAFQCLQLVVTDFLPTMPCTCLQIVVDVAGSFGLQNQELNISLTSIGLLWNISDYFYQRGEQIEQELNREEAVLEKQAREKGVALNRPFHPAPPFDCLWLCLYAKLGELCVDPRPAVRKSAGQTLFSTISAHGTLLQPATWHTVIWKVLFHLLDCVRKSSTTADKEKIESGGGNILIHHSRDTAEKQWAETWVLTLAGVARIFNTRRYLLQSLGDFFKAWEVLLDHIQSAALSKNNEVSLAALKSFQEILQITTPARDAEKSPDALTAMGVPALTDPVPASGPGRPLPLTLPRSDSLAERLGRYEGAEPQQQGEELEDSALWWSAWNTWYRTGTECTRPPASGDKPAFVPSQPFLTALVQIFPALYQHVKAGFSMDDLRKLGVILQGAVSVPISSDASPFILPSYTEAVLTGLQEAVLTALDVLQKAICGGPEHMQAMFPAILDQLLLFVDSANWRPNTSPTPKWVALNYVPFAERSLDVVVDLYQKTACHKAVVSEKVLQNIIKTLRVPLGLKYACPSESTWKLAVSSLLKVLSIGLPVARQHASSGKFDTMWPELANTFEDFLFTKSTPPDNLSIQEFQKNESIDVEVVQLISTEILPFANFIPKEFVGQIMAMLNKGSIHSQSSSFTEAELEVRMREDFSKVCFETLLQFSFSNKTSTPQEGYISRMALSVLLKRSQDVLRRYVEDERLSGRCPLPRQQVAEIIFVLKAVSTLMDSLKKTQPENVDGNTWAQVIALYPTLVECITCSSSEVSSALKEALWPFKDFMQPPVAKVQNGES
ncbi:hypothetical protein JZ751_006259 [Albula glossodonta]|uniref:Protein MON2 homolog n=1 Tax=Albula glossodonta TaxID=121402 RepID=A0A8T2NEN9_9TELE|nr:hypothetical protein JZ751_006259 [Albula glossodonta]